MNVGIYDACPLCKVKWGPSVVAGDCTIMGNWKECRACNITYYIPIRTFDPHTMHKFVSPYYVIWNYNTVQIVILNSLTNELFVIDTLDISYGIELDGIKLLMVFE